MSKHQYSGHGAHTGGLQAHSVGDIYPLTVFGQERPEGFTAYGVLDLATGNTVVPACYTCQDAHEEARRLIERRRVRAQFIANANATIRRLISQGGHHA
jgi:hypothetical protein